MEILSYASANKSDKKALGFEIWNFYGSFSNDIMAVKGLRYHGPLVAWPLAIALGSVVNNCTNIN